MIGIYAIGSYLPFERTSNFRNLEKFDMNESFVRDKIGFTELAKKSIKEETSDLCVKAWSNLQKKIKVSSKDIDCIIVCTQNPDAHGIPHTSAIVHQRL